MPEPFLLLTGEEIHLTPQGRAEGARIIRALRLWERHVADDAGLAESEWHELAERQEHRLTAAETESLEPVCWTAGLRPAGRRAGGRRFERRNIRVGGEGGWQIALPWRQVAPRTG